MQLTKHTDYAFRVLIYLASLPGTDLVKIQDVADLFDISRNHMMKIVNKLARAGFIQSVRGNQGGIRLGAVAESINLRQVIELMETTLAPVNCYEPLCKLEQNCRLKGILFQAQADYLSSVEKYSLADIMLNPIFVGA